MMILLMKAGEFPFKILVFAGRGGWDLSPIWSLSFRNIEPPSLAIFTVERPSTAGTDITVFCLTVACDRVSFHV
jgi:hypothetical protein